MAILRFRIYWEDDDSIYRDVVIKHSQNFAELHESILRSFEFDNKHKATFYRSNDHWLKGREISLEKYDDKVYQVEPLIMSEVTLGSEIKDPNQKFVYVYDFNKHWTFMVELINVDKEENKKLGYPACIRIEGIAPSQYGTKGLVDSRLAEVEEKYDLNAAAMLEGFSEEDEDGNAAESEEESAEEGMGEEDF
jgi:hypothetical protein